MKIVPQWWWGLFLILALLDVVFAMVDGSRDRSEEWTLQLWMLLQAGGVIVGIGGLAALSRDIGYGIIGGLFTAWVLEDWLQVLSPLRLRTRSILHDLWPGSGPAPARLSVPDPADLVLGLVGVALVALAIWLSRPGNRVHVIRLAGFLAVGFAFGGLFDLYNDYNYSRLGALIEETGEAVALSGAFAYLIGIASAASDHPARIVDDSAVAGDS